MLLLFLYTFTVVIIDFTCSSENRKQYIYTYIHVIERIISSFLRNYIIPLGKKKAIANTDCKKRVQ